MYTVIFYKDIETQKVHKRWLNQDLSVFLASVGNPEYLVSNDPEWDAQWDEYFDALRLENGVLSHDIDAVKEEAHVIRKRKINEMFAPYDKIISDINALEIPEEFFSGTHAEAKAEAEAERVLIRELSADIKDEINEATTVQEVNEALELLVA